MIKRLLFSFLITGLICVGQQNNNNLTVSGMSWAHSTVGVPWQQRDADLPAHVVNAPSGEYAHVELTPGETVQNIWYDEHKNSEVRQKYTHDSRIVLKYILDPKKVGQSTVKFPQDFLLEIPREFVTLNPKKHLDEIVVLGSHNCFANKDDGFLYYQQGESSYKQYKHGARMLRPAWHNPSGSPIDAPNQEPILCHSGDDQCKTVSLATRGFKAHELVREELQMLAKVLNQENQEDILILNVNNYLTPKGTDDQIKSVPDLAKLVLTVSDVNNLDNKHEWKGFWPTIEWMKKHNKRVIIFSDRSAPTKDYVPEYAFDYYTYIRVNEYGTTDVNKGGMPRNGTLDSYKNLSPYALVELSWFQNISLNPNLIGGLSSAVDFFYAMKNKLLKIPSFIKIVLPNSVVEAINDFHANISLPVLKKSIDFIFDKISYFQKIPGVSSLFNMIKDKKNAIDSAINDIQKYIPEKQDNSLSTLLQLVAVARKNQVILPHRVPNIVMLDFSTTTGDGIVVVNLLNFLHDRAMKLGFMEVGGFALDGKPIAIPEGVAS